MNPRPVRQLPAVLCAGVDPVDVLTPGPESSTPDHRGLTVARLAPPPGLGIGDHPEAAAGGQGEGLGEVGHLSSLPQRSDRRFSIGFRLWGPSAGGLSGTGPRLPSSWRPVRPLCAGLGRSGAVLRPGPPATSNVRVEVGRPSHQDN